MTKGIPAERLKLKRAYEAPAPGDGTRILVDRLWPRGLNKEAAALDHWMKEIAPSTELRKWFHRDPERWSEFRRRYAKELESQAGHLDEVRKLVRHGPVTLVYAARDQQRNHAAVLRDVLLQA